MTPRPGLWYSMDSYPGDDIRVDLWTDSCRYTNVVRYGTMFYDRDGCQLDAEPVAWSPIPTELPPLLAGPVDAKTHDWCHKAACKICGERHRQMMADMHPGTVTCDRCDGTGAHRKEPWVCSYCNGTGRMAKPVVTSTSVPPPPPPNR